MEEILTDKSEDVLNPTQFSTIIKRVKYLEDSINELEKIIDRFSHDNREYMQDSLDRLYARSMINIIKILDTKPFSSTLESFVYLSDLEYLEKSLYRSAKIYEKYENEIDNGYVYKYIIKRIGRIRINIFKLMVSVVEERFNHMI